MELYRLKSILIISNTKPTFMSRNETELNLMRSHLTDLTTSFARVPNSLFCLFEPRMSLVASLTPRALFLVRIVFTVALKRAVLSILFSEQKPAEILRNR